MAVFARLIAERNTSPWRFLPAILVAWSCAAAEVMPPKPANYFNDYAGVVPAAVAQRLNRTLEDFEKATSSQVVVAVFPKLETDSSLEDYTHRIFQRWAIGQKGKDNGAVLFVFIKDRKMRIEVGYGLEGALPDALAKRIIEDEIKPAFQRGDYGAGLSAGVAAMLQATRGEYKGAGRTVARTKANRNVIPPLVVFLVVFIIIVANTIRRVASGTVYHSSGRSYRGGWYWGGGSSGWSGGGSWGGGGGGGFSGGGGSSGGGGASGSW